MKLRFLPEARIEFEEAVDFYEEKEPELGSRYNREIREICSTILSHPLLWRERPGGFRRVNCPIFPFYIAYFIRGDTVLIAAIAHESRHPDYWKARMPG